MKIKSLCMNSKCKYTLNDANFYTFHFQRAYLDYITSLEAHISCVYSKYTLNDANFYAFVSMLQMVHHRTVYFSRRRPHQGPEFWGRPTTSPRRRPCPVSTTSPGETTGVDFYNFLQAAFLCTDPKNAKKTMMT